MTTGILGPGKEAAFRSSAGRRGQAMIEYMIGAVILVGAVTILAVLLYKMRENGVRVLDLVASEYP
jgi:hypothetical protein